MAVARGGGLKFLCIISILRLEYTNFFKIFRGACPRTPLDRLRAFGARTKRSALSESSPPLCQNLATALQWGRDMEI